MVSARKAIYYVFHPAEVRSMIQWGLFHDPVHSRDKTKESETVAKCYFWLEKTSRSFSSVILELHPELKLPVAIFYLILRGLDTIEDDMTIPLKIKAPLLEEFDQRMEQDGWNFQGSGPNEKDRALLENFEVVVAEYKQMKPAYKEIIIDITKQMGDGMSKYAAFSEQNRYIETKAEYDEYCFFVAGLVGEGLTRLFVKSELGNPLLLERPWLHRSMGLFLQKTNITRDIREDFDDNKRWWPREIWSQHVDKFEDLFKPDNKQKALDCSSAMVLDALQHVEECLFYLLGLKEQSVFNFCAIPQSMAIATLEVCFQNYAIFEKNVKITKGSACQLMMESTQDQRTVFYVFRKYIHKILKKNNPKDPNYLKIGMACAKIEKFILSTFPEKDPKPYEKTDEEISVTSDDAKALQKTVDDEAKWDIVYMGLSVLTVLLVMSGLMLAIAYLAGARFDIVIDQLRQGIFKPVTSTDDRVNVVRKYDHGEL